MQFIRTASILEIYPDETFIRPPDTQTTKSSVNTRPLATSSDFEGGIKEHLGRSVMQLNELKAPPIYCHFPLARERGPYLAIKVGPSRLIYSECLIRFPVNCVDKFKKKITSNQKVATTFTEI